MNPRLNLLRLSLLLATLLLAACQGQNTPEATQRPVQPTYPPLRVSVEPSGPTETPLPTATLRPSSTPLPTGTAIPSFTPAPTATITLTPTAAPPLAEGQPYLVYYGRQGDQPALILLNDSGSGRRVIPLPEGSLLPDLPAALSPDGRWLALYTGSAGDPQALSRSEGPFDLTLHLLRLPDGELRTVTPLLAGSYPRGLERAASRAAEKQPAGGLSQANLLDFIWERFLAGATNAQWSPDSTTLAFAGQMDGDSLDIYLYDLASGQVRRAAAGEEQLQWMYWSPDGRYLLHSRANRPCEIDCDTKYALNVSSGELQPLSNLVTPGGQTVLYDWAGASTMLFYTNQPGRGPRYLRQIDVASNQAADLYGDAFVWAEVDRERQLLALHLNNDLTAVQPLEEGIYLYNQATAQRSLVASFATYGPLRPVFWGDLLYRFLLYGEDKIYGLTADGRVDLLAEGRFRALSPNRRLVLVGELHEGANSLLVIDSRGAAVQRINAEQAGDLFWNSTSTGLFSVQEERLYHLSLQQGQWFQVDSNLPEPLWEVPPRILFGWKK